MEGVGEILDATLKRPFLFFFFFVMMYFGIFFMMNWKGEKAEGSKGRRVDLTCPVEKCPLMVVKVTSVY